ncbi:hypothetical protein EGR_10770 [Echinococcus granulosus]|uniref:Uncharacterized protein n=1 Tax=Echinococcus granulosus TaxID=6210 RepID=W6U034_ECHGR|nr:hypothetical protein EGR_10770 [Echinococcus granulosus]EUB54373.1 hypothetical protein EGR_10770 [Echinococcus granulosus]
MQNPLSSGVLLIYLSSFLSIYSFIFFSYFIYPILTSLTTTYLLNNLVMEWLTKYTAKQQRHSLEDNSSGVRLPR